MRILHVNKFLYRRGGAESYMGDVADAQRAAGHDVEFFGMAHRANPSLRFERHFPRELELDPPPAGAAAKAMAVGRMLWSTSARRGIDAVVDEFAPDLVHLHNIYYHLSPSILGALARRRVPMVMTLHDYKLACTTYQFLDHGEPCTACLDRRFRHAIQRRCNDGSLAASAVSAFELWVHTHTNAYGPIGAFIGPSRFLVEKMRTAGVFPERLRHVENFVAQPAPPRAKRDGVIVFAGRLSPEKGVDTLIAAAGALDSGTRLEIAGEGPDQARLARLAESQAPGRVTFHGRLDKAGVDRLLAEAAVVALPARWYENQPMVVLEALRAGTAVVATDMGGLPELIEPGITGDLVPPDDPGALAVALKRFVDDPDHARAIGAVAQQRATDRFSAATHLAALDAVYAEVRP